MYYDELDAAMHAGVSFHCTRSPDMRDILQFGLDGLDDAVPALEIKRKAPDLQPHLPSYVGQRSKQHAIRCICSFCAAGGCTSLRWRTVSVPNVIGRLATAYMTSYPPLFSRCRAKFLPLTPPPPAHAGPSLSHCRRAATRESRKISALVITWASPSKMT